MKLISDNEMLLHYVPNSIKPTPGELSLFDKIHAHLVCAEKWVEQTFTGPSLLDDFDSLDPKLVYALRLIVASEALCRAVPALDMVLTPNGFGVVSTNTVAAASKQRVDRLVGSLSEARDAAIEDALRLLPKAVQWHASQPAAFFGATLFPNIDLPALCGCSVDRWEKYLQLRAQVVGIELTLAEEFFSPELLEELRRELLSDSLSSARRHLVRLLQSQIVEVLLDKPINGSRMRDLVNFIRYNPQTFAAWHSSQTAKLFSPPKFENKKTASGYFF